MTAFVPRREDGKPEWSLIYDRIRDLPIGAVIGYEEISAVLGRDFLPSRPGIYRAIEELRRNRQRSMVCVPNVGYRVLHPSEHEDQAGAYRRRGRRNIGTALQVVRATDVTLLSPDEHKRVDALSMVLSQTVHAVDYLARRQRRTEKILSDVAVQAETTEAKVSEMQEALRAAGLLSSVT